MKHRKAKGFGCQAAAPRPLIKHKRMRRVSKNSYINEILNETTKGFLLRRQGQTVMFRIDSQPVDGLI